MSVLAHINALSLGYSDRPLFSGLSFDIEKGMMLAVLGSNGTGKALLLKQFLDCLNLLLDALIGPMANS